MGNNIYPGIKTAYCYTCKKPLHYLGIASHRALHHRDRGIDCTIRYTHGEIYTWKYSQLKNQQEKEAS